MKIHPITYGFDGFATLMVSMVSQHWWFRWFRNLDGFDGFSTLMVSMVPQHWWFPLIWELFLPKVQDLFLLDIQELWSIEMTSLYNKNEKLVWPQKHRICYFENVRTVSSKNVRTVLTKKRKKNCIFRKYKSFDELKWPHYTIKTKVGLTPKTKIWPVKIESKPFFTKNLICSYGHYVPIGCSGFPYRPKKNQVFTFLVVLFDRVMSI